MKKLSEFYPVTLRFDLFAIFRSRNNQQIADVISGKFEELDRIVLIEPLIAFITFSLYDLELIFSTGE
tara:strand:- start:39 stop:242 length:204 start_codon:yes stop_codon:yes gene_type:complete